MSSRWNGASGDPLSQHTVVSMNRDLVVQVPARLSLEHFQQEVRIHCDPSNKGTQTLLGVIHNPISQSYQKNKRTQIILHPFRCWEPGVVQYQT